eukprot:GHVP01069966.1.p1 GENE.GHVP01069966.1~~GHVP01069966.1.p1  ORF type:complete len:885 (+),score=184.61 GHVP01069966.1:1633-4287(+)
MQRSISESTRSNTAPKELRRHTICDAPVDVESRTIASPEKVNRTKSIVEISLLHLVDFILFLSVFLGHFYYTNFYWNIFIIILAFGSSLGIWRRIILCWKKQEIPAFVFIRILATCALLTELSVFDKNLKLVFFFSHLSRFIRLTLCLVFGVYLASLCGKREINSETVSESFFSGFSSCSLEKDLEEASEFDFSNEERDLSSKDNDKILNRLLNFMKRFFKSYPLLYHSYKQYPLLSKGPLITVLLLTFILHVGCLTFGLHMFMRRQEKEMFNNFMLPYLSQFDYENLPKIVSLMEAGGNWNIAKIRQNSIDYFNSFLNEDLEIYRNESTEILISRSKQLNLEKKFSLAASIASSLILTSSALVLAYEAQVVLLTPLRNIMNSLQKIKKNPLLALQMEKDLMAKKLEVVPLKSFKRWSDISMSSYPDENAFPASNELSSFYTAAPGFSSELSSVPHPRWPRSRVKKLLEYASKQEITKEAKLLEETLVRFGSLLALGFGEAGVKIISDSFLTSDGEFDSLASGRRVSAIFGFCDIRNFTQISELMGEDVFLYVNAVAKIVHSIVDAFSGSVNRNMGDAFLCVWKLPTSHPYFDFSINSEANYHSRDHEAAACWSRLAELSMAAFAKVHAEIARSQEILKFNKKYFGGIKLEMGFGLHVGDAIEGAIGSQFKIDASYLSSTVNIASRLESVTKKFGVPIIVSETLYKLATLNFQKLLRPLDKVVLKGSSTPTRIFSLDLDSSSFRLENSSEWIFRDKANVLVETTNAFGILDNTSGLEILASDAKRTRTRRSLWKPSVKVEKIFVADPVLNIMRKETSEEFLAEFIEAENLYEKGLWGEAFKKLESCKKTREATDGPTETLIQYISGFEKKAPDDWQGFRYLDEK